MLQPVRNIVTKKSQVVVVLLLTKLKKVWLHCTILSVQLPVTYSIS